MDTRLILMCGLPGSGKTTLAKRLATEVPAVRLCPDDWLYDLGIDLHDEVSRERLETIFWEHAQILLRLGTSVILESGHWLRSDRDQKRLAARALGVAVELRYLDVPFDELVRRVEARNQSSSWRDAPITRELMEGYRPYFNAPGPDEQALFDRPS